MYPSVHCCAIYNSQDVDATWCPLTDEWIRKQWYVYTITVYYSDIKSKESESVAVRRMNLEPVRTE